MLPYMRVCMHVYVHAFIQLNYESHSTFLEIALPVSRFSRFFLTGKILALQKGFVNLIDVILAIQFLRSGIVSNV